MCHDNYHAALCSFEPAYAGIRRQHLYMPSNNMHAGWGVDIIATVRGVPVTLLARYLAKDITL